MGSVLSSLGLRSAQSSGLSPSPTEETGHKPPSGQDAHAEEELKSSVTDEKPLEEPESNDTSYGVEATAVRTLAASTGTVAILGTTAKVKELNEPASIDSRHSPTEHAQNGLKETIPQIVAQNENTDITASSEMKKELHSDPPDPLKQRLEEEGKEAALQAEEVVCSLKPEERKTYGEAMIETKDEKGDEEEEVREEKEEGKEKVAEETGEVNEDNGDQSLASLPDKIEKHAIDEIIIPSSTNVVMEIEKEPVRIVDYQEKKDRTHEPKIVEEMSVKKEDNLNKVSITGDISLEKEENVDKNVLIGKQEQKLINEERLKNIVITTEESNKTTPESDTISPEASKTEEDNEISSEQLKTNSLSDMSLSENLSSEGEEAAREAAKAQELKEMVASLSATANHVTLDSEINEGSNSPKDVPIVSLSLNIPEEPGSAKGEPSIVNDVQEKKNDNSFETHQLVGSDDSSEKNLENISIPSESVGTIPSNANLQSEKESNTVKEEDRLEDSINIVNVDQAEDGHEERGKDEIESGQKSLEEIKAEIINQDKIMVLETLTQPQDNKVEQEEVEIHQRTLESKENEEASVEGIEEEAKLRHEGVIVTEQVKEEQDTNKEQKEEREEINLKEEPIKEVVQLTSEAELKEIAQADEDAEKSQVKDNSEIIAAATTIQSGFRGYQVRKNLKESEAEKESNEYMLEEEEKKVTEEENKLLNGGTSLDPEIFNEKEHIEEPEKDVLAISNSEIEEDDVKHVPESLMKIAQAEVDKICNEAEKATESLISPTVVKNDSEIQEEEFPAPPDDLLTSESQNEEVKEEQSSSGTLSTEPTMPLGNNHTEGDSSKTEDTTAPSLAESEMPKSLGLSPSLQNDDFRLESSVTENVNTEIAMQRDSTEGELTMEEDSTREDDVLVPTQSDIVSKTDGEDSLTPNEEKAATVIQAGYRGFKTRKRLREESSNRSQAETVGEEDIKDDSRSVKSLKKDDSDSNSSYSITADKSEKELNDSAKMIQAGVRGYLVRKKQKVERDAAVTIQSHFRGFKTRQRLKQKST